MEDPTSSPEILRDASLQETLEEQCLELLKSAEPENLEVQKPKKRNDTPWPSQTESKIQLTISSVLNSEERQSEYKDVEFLTPKQLDFSLSTSPSMIEFEGETSLDLTNPQLCTGDAPPNTPNLSNLEEELTKKAKQQEDNLKEHFEKMAPHSSLQPLDKKMRKKLNFSKQSAPRLNSTENEALPNTPTLAKLQDLDQKIFKEEAEDLDFSLPSTSRLTLGEIKAQQNAPSLVSLENLAQKISPNLDLDFSLPSSSDEDYLKEDMDNADERKIENIQETEAKEVVRINHYHRIPSGFVKEKDRKKRQNKAAEELKRLVPGLEPKSKEIKVCEMTIKYIEFMKTHLGPDVDEEFLMNQIF